MGFWSAYKASLKPLAVEEPIDLWVHRPLGYVVARVLMPTPISPNMVTFASIIAGLGAAACISAPFRSHSIVAGGLLFGSAVLDCADGQLARMRKSSSVFGRMLDGSADLLTIGVVAPLAAYHLVRPFTTPMWLGLAVALLAVLTMVTTSFHTTMYDHYKNVFLRLTGTFAEGEDYEAAEERYQKTRSSLGLLARITYPVYLFYLKNQRDYVLAFDPYTSARLTLFPPYDAARAAVYQRHSARVLGVFKGLLGFGSLVFGLAVSIAFDVLIYYMAFRLILLNGIFYGYVRPAQRRASREAFREMGIRLPDQRA